MSDESHEFGGDWTEEKLRRLGKYLPFYTTALKNFEFELAYIDAFAGTGYRKGASKNDGQELQLEMEELGKSVETVQSGSARIALKTKPPFCRYIFIEKSPNRITALKSLVHEFPNRADRVEFINDDANSAIKEICARPVWKNQRAVLFLDPYGAQVDWTTIKTIADSGKIDLWYLFPYIAVNRMTRRDGRNPASWEKTLDSLFGEPNWRTEFYTESSQTDLFSEPAKEKSTSPERVEQYIIKRLKTICPPGGVANRGLKLVNSRGTCMYILLFACTNENPRAQKLALKVAGPLLRS